jgi:YVTN family beta-propeller protein
MIYHRHRYRVATLLVTSLTAAVAVHCGGGAAVPDGPTPAPDAAPIVVAKFPSRSAPIALNPSETVVAMVNPDSDSVSFFDAVTNARIAVVTVGDEPSSLVFSPDGKQLFVALRAAAAVVKLSGADTATPIESGRIDVGSEPTGIALSPTGATLFVSEWAEGRVSAIDTATMAEKGATAEPSNPRAIAVTNNGDASDADELVVVPEFYGAPTGTEGGNDSRKGVVRLLNAKDLTTAAVIELPALDTGFKRDLANPPLDTDDVRGTGPAVLASPNQLTSVAISNGRAYISALNAAPAIPVRFNSNVFSTVYVINLTTREVVTEAAGGTIVLAKGIAAIVEPATGINFSTVKATGARLMMGDIQDVATVPGRDIAYAVSRAADGIQRMAFTANGVSLGSAQNKQMDVTGVAGAGQGCKNPTGMAIKEDGTKAFVHCTVSRRLGVIDLQQQTLVAAVESAGFPAPSSEEERVQIGKRFYFTGRARWSKNGEGWSSCGSCHPDALSDNMTWIFGTGPRQTTSQDGSFSHGAAGMKQRIFNWSGVFDEHHDFERNVRDVSGGLGAVTKPKAGQACGNITNEDPLALGPNLGKPVKVTSDTEAGGCVLPDWDEVDAYVKTIRPARAVRKVDIASVARGRTIFETQGACIQCHSGAGWTVSRRFRNPPSEADNIDLAAQLFKRGVGPLVWTLHEGGKQIEPQLAIADPDGRDALGAVVNLPPAQMSCVLRNVGTFGISGNATATDALEVRSAPAAIGASSTTRAQGRGGYNVPALYGLTLGAPYLHHGQARSLEELFSDPRFESHRTAAAANFAPAGQQLADLVNFLRSIDKDTAEFAVPIGYDWCP